MKCYSEYTHKNGKNPHRIKFEWPNNFAEAMNNVLKDSWLDEPLRGFRSTPAVNISETDEAYWLELAAPGYERENFKIDLDADTLKISSPKHTETNTEHEHTKRYRKQEFKYAYFERSFKLPKDTERQNITAKYHNGILLVMIPKLVATKADNSHSIPVE